MTEYSIPEQKHRDALISEINELLDEYTLIEQEQAEAEVEYEEF